jgi:hypothetical protein
MSEEVASLSSEGKEKAYFSFLRKFILELIPKDGRPIGNKNLRLRIQEKFENVSDSDIKKSLDKMIEENILMRGRGNGGSVRRTGFDINEHNKYTNLKVPKPKIFAIFMSGLDDKNPEYIGRNFVENLQNDEQRSQCDWYAEQSGIFRKTGQGPHLACSYCYQPVYVRGVGSNSQRRTLYHTRNADRSCLVLGKHSKGNPAAKIHEDADGNLSEIHEDAIKKICESLMLAHPPIFGSYIQSSLSDAELLNFVETGKKRLLSPPRCNQNLKVTDERFRRPDIAFSLVDEFGNIENWVFEVQRSVIMRNILVARNDDYRKNDIRALWIMIDSIADNPHKEAAKFFGSIHRGCQFLYNDGLYEVFTSTKKLSFLSRTLEYEFDEEDGEFKTKNFEDDLVIFPDGFCCKNGFVFHKDHMADSVEKAFFERRKLASEILGLLSRYAGSRDAQVEQFEICKKALHKFILSFVGREKLQEVLHERSSPSSKIWRTISVMLTMLERVVSGNPNVNFTQSFNPSGSLIFCDDPINKLYDQIVLDFAFRVGYADFHRAHIDDNAVFKYRKSSYDRQFKFMSEIERVYLRGIFGEIYSSSAVGILSSVDRLPFWAIK